MSVTSVDTDYDNLTTTLVADLDAPIDEVWELWADPRKLERWWGPPTYPATFEKHDLSPGGETTYFMTGPEGDQPRGWWRITSVDPPTSLRVHRRLRERRRNAQRGDAGDQRRSAAQRAC